MKNVSQAAIEAVDDLRTHIPACIGAGVVDLSTGLMIAVDTTDNHPRVVLDMLAEATVDIFQGRNVVMIEEMFKRQRGVKDDHHYFQEILINSEYLCHLFIRSRAIPDIVAVAVSLNTADMGQMFIQTRAVMRHFENVAA
jgi:hypothetical protein